MTRKRFVKLAMAEGMTRDEAVTAARYVLEIYGCYQHGYSQLGIIRGRFECYMPGHEKIVAKRNKRATERGHLYYMERSRFRH